VDVKSLVPFGKGGETADLGQSRGAQAGEADRHAVWLAANNLEPKLSPFDPLAVLDEIARLVPGYALDRINLFSGNDVPTEPGSAQSFVPVSDLTAPVLSKPELSKPDQVVPAHDGLFTSGTLGRYSHALNELARHQAHELAESAAD
jgi:NADH-quinone oxidoreductase subunit G